MNNVPKKLKDKWSTEKQRCCREDEGNCSGRLTKDHTITWKGRQLQEDWAIVDVCEFHHAVNRYMDCGDLNREKHVHIALQRATEAELRSISKAIDYITLKKRLEEKYGTYPQRKPTIN